MAGRGEQQQDWPVKVRPPGAGRSQSRSATRALDVLELFGELRRPMRAVEIARSLDLHPSTANQLLKTMVESAHLVFDARTKAYLPSPRLALFGGWITHCYGSDERLRQMIERLHSASGLVVTLTTPNDLFMQVVEFAGGDLPVAAAQRGLRVSMFGSAIGAAFLSSVDGAEVERLAHRARFPETEMPSLNAWLARVRSEGFADGPSAQGTIWSLAAPLPSTGQNAPLVVGMAGAAELVCNNLAIYGALLRTAITQREG